MNYSLCPFKAGERCDETCNAYNEEFEMGFGCCTILANMAENNETMLRVEELLKEILVVLQ